MRMNALIPMGAQQVDMVGAYAQGKGMYDQQQNQNALRQYGGAAMQGDQNALRQLANYDPQLAMGLQSSQQDMEMQRNDNRRADAGLAIDQERLSLAKQQAAQQAQQHAASMSAMEREQAAAEVGKIAQAATLAWQGGEQEFQRFMGSFGDQMPEELRGLSYQDAPYAIAAATGMVEGFQAAPTDETAEMRNLRFRAEQAGLTEGTPEYQSFMANGGVPRGMSLSVGADGAVNFSDGPQPGAAGLLPKPPAGFTNVPQEDGTVNLAPVKGGPGTQLPAELAARIAVADDGLRVLPDIIERAANGDLTGVLDWAYGTVGRGQQGTDRRDIKGASEAITRLLTGAGMNNTEIQNEAWMYTPAITDDAPTVVSKLKRLHDKLKAAKEAALTGRGGAVSIDPNTGMGAAQAATPPPDTGSATSGGVKWRLLD